MLPWLASTAFCVTSTSLRFPRLLEHTPCLFVNIAQPCMLNLPCIVVVDAGVRSEIDDN